MRHANPSMRILQTANGGLSMRSIVAFSILVGTLNVRHIIHENLIRAFLSMNIASSYRITLAESFEKEVVGMKSNSSPTMPRKRF